MSLAKSVIKRQAQLEKDRENFDTLWQEVGDFVLPNRSDFRRHLAKGQKRRQHLYDGTGEQAVNIFASSIMGFLTNPATKWFNLRLQDPTLNKVNEVKVWLADAENKILDVLNGSNFNEQIHEVYIDLGSIGTAVLLEEEDGESIVRFTAIFI